jgi:hypothetical protein
MALFQINVYVFAYSGVGFKNPVSHNLFDFRFLSTEFIKLTLETLF